VAAEFSFWPTRIEYLVRLVCLQPAILLIYNSAIWAWLQGQRRHQEGRDLSEQKLRDSLCSRHL